MSYPERRARFQEPPSTVGSDNEVDAPLHEGLNHEEQRRGTPRSARRPSSSTTPKRSRPSQRDTSTVLPFWQANREALHDLGHTFRVHDDGFKIIGKPLSVNQIDTIRRVSLKYDRKADYPTRREENAFDYPSMPHQSVYAQYPQYQAYPYYPTHTNLSNSHSYSNGYSYYPRAAYANYSYDAQSDYPSSYASRRPAFEPEKRYNPRFDEVDRRSRYRESIPRRYSRRSPSEASSERAPSPPPAPAPTSAPRRQTTTYDAEGDDLEDDGFDDEFVPLDRTRPEIIIRRAGSPSNDAAVETTAKPSRVQYGAIVYDTVGRSGVLELNRPRHLVRNFPIKTILEFTKPSQIDLGSAQPESSEFAQPESVAQAAFVITRYLGERGRGYSRRRDRRQSLDSDDSTDNEIKVECDAGTVIKINSPHIIDTIEKVAGTYPGLCRDGNSLIIPEPFCALVHFRDQIIAQDPEKEKLQNGESPHGPAVEDKEETLPVNSQSDVHAPQLTDVQLLYEFIDQQCLGPSTEEKNRWQQRGTCTFEWVWMLFAPGTMVYQNPSTNETLMQAYRVVDFHLEGLFEYEGGKPTVQSGRLKPEDLTKQNFPLERIMIKAESLRHDGRYWQTLTHWFEISAFRGESQIRDLHVYPASYYNGSVAEMEGRLLKRGRQYHSLATRGQVEYHGDVLSGVRRRLDGRIVVDSETFHYEPYLVTGKEARDPEKQKSDADMVFRKSNPNLQTDATSTIQGYTPFHDVSDQESDGGLAARALRSSYAVPGQHATDPITRLRDLTRSQGAFATSLDLRDASPSLDFAELPELTDQEYMICAPEIQAYALKERAWVLVAVENASDCVYEETMIDNLQISPEANRLVQALSHTRKLPSKKSKVNGTDTARKPWTSDFISNKGGGQIILLHGRPGVGKTTTAECIAELTNRPLLTITCGDLGIDAISVEGELGRWLRIGTLWNAVLLFDEADVFLESRAHGDIDRNSLVSVFLRALEYYQGLMFLTTNRIGSFDEAIISRIHVVLHLPNLTNTDRARIWDSSFRKLAKERKDIHVDYTLMNYAHHDTAVHELQWNGREIRNAFNTMIALAEWDAQKDDRYTEDGKVEVRREHLEEVVKMSGTFKGYLRSLRQMEHEQYMKSLGLRDDKYRAPEKR